MTPLRPAIACLRASESIPSFFRRLAFPTPRDWFPPSKALLFLAVCPYTMLSRARLDALYTLAAACNRDLIPGAFVECGTWRGGSGAVLAAQSGGRGVHLLDSFQGCPEPGPSDVDFRGRAGTKGEACAGPSDLRGILEALGLWFSKFIWVHPGWFSDTLPFLTRAAPYIALLHLDADWRESTAICLEYLYPRISPGGYIVIDDYGFWRGCREAVDEFRSLHGITQPIHWSDHTGIWWRKL